MIDGILLAAFERKILRRIFGLYVRRVDLNNDKNIIQRIKLGRIRWAGHILRIREDDLARSSGVQVDIE